MKSVEGGGKSGKRESEKAETDEADLKTNLEH